MKSMPTLFLVVLPVAAVLGANNEKVPPAPQDIAVSFFEAAMNGDVDKANAISAVPFSWDRKKILKTKEELKEVFRDIPENKNKEKIPEYKMNAIKITDKAPKLDPKVFPAHVVFRISFIVDGGHHEHHMDIYVKKVKPPKVIGFSD